MHLKKQAIDSLDLFLRFSRRLLVLWSPEYPTRLWCAYELATFIKIHPDGASRVDVMPGWLPQLVIMMNVFVAFAMPLCPLTVTGPAFAYTADALGAYFGYIVNLAAILLVLTAIGTVFLYLKVYQHTEMLRQLRGFRIADASCANPQDVTYVHGLIDVMWSTTPQANDGKERFEHFVRVELASQLESAFGARTRLPYTSSLIAFLPVFGVCGMLALVCDAHMLEMWGYVGADGAPALRSWGLRWLWYSVELWFFANPISTVFAQVALAWCVDAGRGAASCILVGTLAYWGSLMPLIALIVKSVMYEPVQGSAAEATGAALLLVLTLVCYPPKSLRSLLRLDGEDGQVPPTTALL